MGAPGVRIGVSSRALTAARFSVGSPKGPFELGCAQLYGKSTRKSNTEVEDTVSIEVEV